MVDNSSAFELWPIVHQCAQRRLAELRVELDYARRSEKLRDIGEIGQSGSRSFRTATWDSAVSNGDTLHLNKGTVADIADYHDSLNSFHLTTEEARMNFARLAVLRHAPGAIDDNTLSSARLILAELEQQLSMSRLVAGILLDVHKSLGLKVEYLPFNGKPRSRAQAIRAIRSAPICRPLLVNGHTATVG